MSVVLFEKREPIALITINRPEAMNALSSEVQAGLRDAWQQVESDDDIRVAILTGIGDRAFSAGADLKQYGRGSAGGTGPRLASAAGAGASVSPGCQPA